MANTETLIVKSTKASIDANTAMKAPQITGLIAGENIAVCDACYIKAADGKVYRCSAAAADEKARLAGVAPRAAKAGEPITLFSLGLLFKYSDASLVPGAIIFLAEAAGALSTTATTGDAVGVGQAVDTNNIRITRGV